MKYFVMITLIVLSLYSEELDIFDSIDVDESSFEIDEKKYELEFKLNYQFNNKTDNNKFLFVNFKSDTKNYVIDTRIIANDENQSLLLKEIYYRNIYKENHFTVGRMNNKYGVSKGYNPTDYFRTNSSLTLSNDPKERKDNRLGSLAIRDTIFLDNWIFKALYSPKIETKENSILSDKEYIGIHFDKTNAQNRASFSVDYSGINNSSIAMILHHNEDGLNIGTNLSYIYKKTIFYAELSYNKGNGEIKKVMDSLNLHPSLYDSFVNSDEDIYQSSLGFTYINDFNIVTSVEYIYNSVGFDSKDWKNFFVLMNTALGPQLGLLRGVLAKNNALMSRDTIFILIRASDLYIDLDVNLITQLNPYDMSSLTQLGFEYALSDIFQTNASFTHYFGNEESEYGSMQNKNEILLEMKYFF